MKDVDYITCIDKYVKKWHDISKNQIGMIEEWDDFFKDNPYSFLKVIPFRYFPEPYIGNPSSKDLKAVFLNLNPGAGGDMQDVYNNHPLNILRIFEDKNQCYYNTIISFIENNENFFLNDEFFKKDKPLKNQLKNYKNDIKNKDKILPILHDTFVWWYDNRLLWLKKVLNLKDVPSLKNIFGIELTPWHSLSFSEMGNTFNQDVIWQYVLKPAIEISNNIEEGCFKKDNRTIVISKGAALKKILSKKSLEKLRKKFPELSKSAEEITPVSGYNNWYKWTYECISTNRKCYILVYTKPGFDMRIEQSKNLTIMFEKVLTEIDN